MFIFDATDSRSIKALQIAATASEWLHVTRHDGRQLLAIPSQSRAGVFYLIDVERGVCDCQDARRHGLNSQRIGLDGPHFQCKHVRAAALYGELLMAQQALPKKQRGHLRLVTPTPAAECAF